jgi:hypothetical protein
MKFFAATLIAIIPLSAFARMGETKEQCDKRYGKLIIPPLESDGVQYLNYRVHGFALDLHIIDSTCQKLRYRKEDEGMLAKEEVEALLSENGKGWQQTSETEWSNEQCTAKVWGKYLVIVNKDYQKQIDAKRQAD